MWMWKDKPIVLHRDYLAFNQADVFGTQQHSSSSRWRTQNTGAMVNICCSETSTDGWLPVYSSSGQRSVHFSAKHWLVFEVGMLPSLQPKSLFSFPFQWHTYCHCLTVTYRKVSTFVWMHNLFFFHIQPVPWTSKLHSASFVCLDYNGPNGWHYHLLRAIIWALSLLFPGFSGDGMLFIYNIAAGNLCSC